MSDQAAELRKRIDELRSIKQAKTIAIISGKGGVGKSNFALNFSLALSQKGKSVLIFDLDIGMGNIDILLGVSAKYSIVHLFDEHLSIEDIIEQGPHNLSYIAAGSGLADIFSMDEEKFQYFLGEFKKLINSYDYILFDMGAGVTEGSMYFMLAADECFVVTTPEPTSLTDAYAIIKHITQKNKDMNIRLLVNRALNHKNGLNTMNRLQHVINRFLNVQINPLGILPDDRTVSEAVVSQVPFLLFDQKSSVARAITQIADQYTGQDINIEKKVPSFFLSKLRKFIKER